MNFFRSKSPEKASVEQSEDVKHERKEKLPVFRRADSTPKGLELTTSLPEGSAVNSLGVPTYAGASGNRLVFLITVTATIGFALFGYDQGVMAGIITGAQFVQTFPACDIAVQGATRASLLQATYTSVYELGCLAGATSSLLLGNKLGRRKMIQMGSIIMILGVIIQVTAIKGYNAGAQFLIGRIITGVGNGMNTSTIPSWVAETSKSHNRGLLVSIEASMIAAGTALAYWIDFGLSFVLTSVNWRFPIAFQVIFAFGLLFGVAYLPESPRWLIHSGQHVEGQRVCAALVDAPYDDERTIEQTRVIMDTIAQSKAYGVIKKRNMFTNGSSQHFRRMMLGASSQIFQQIGGANAVIYFAPVIFEQNLGLTRQLSLILGGLTVTIYAFGSIVSYYTVEKVGRRPMFIIGSIGQAFAMFLVFICLVPGTPAAAKGSVVGIFLYLFTFGATWLQLPWLYPAEINPLRTRTNANAVSTQSNWIFNFAIVQITPVMLTAITNYTFLVFAVINVCFIPVIYLFYPETSGRTLEEIDIIFAVAYTENKSYVHVAKNMPKLTDSQVSAEAIRLNIGMREDEENGEGSHEGSTIG